MANEASNAEQIGRIIGAAALEVVSETMGDDTPSQQNETSNNNNNGSNQDDTIHGRGESGLGGEASDGTPLRKDGEPDGRSTSPNRGGKGRDND
ncbi:hypothetical protein D3C76_02570 [compost metagenome]